MQNQAAGGARGLARSARGAAGTTPRPPPLPSGTPHPRSPAPPPGRQRGPAWALGWRESAAPPGREAEGGRGSTPATRDRPPRRLQAMPSAAWAPPPAPQPGPALSPAGCPSPSSQSPLCLAWTWKPSRLTPIPGAA